MTHPGSRVSNASYTVLSCIKKMKRRRGPLEVDETSNDAAIHCRAQGISVVDGN